MTTICAVKKDNQLAMAGDGQVTMGEQVIMKQGATKLRRIYHNKVVIGFAGGVADAITLSEMFEDKLNEQTKQLEKYYKQKLKNLEELKKSILQKAFSGELLNDS